VKSELYCDLVTSARFRPHEQAMRRMACLCSGVIESPSQLIRSRDRQDRDLA
jgi:hypothetical protein